MQEVAKAAIYVSPAALAAMWIGSNADTDWGAILIGVLVGCVASALWVALRKAFKKVAPEVRAVFSDAPVQRSTKPRRAQWHDIVGEEVNEKQIEAPRAVVVARGDERKVKTKPKEVLT